MKEMFKNIGLLLTTITNIPLNQVTSPSKQGFSVQQTLTPNHICHGPTEYMNALRKYSLSMDKRTAARSLQVGSVPAIPQEFDVRYTCPVMIGNPPQSLNLKFDTGSADLWVFSSDTNSSQVLGQTIYRPEDSTTARKLDGLAWKSRYGDGSTTHGFVYSDTVSVGGLSVPYQAVEVPEQVSSRFSQDSLTSGLLGLAFSSLNRVRPEKQETFFEKAQSLLEFPLFTANLKHNEPGNYNFGYINSSEHIGAIIYTFVNSSGGFWEITSDKYAVGSNRFMEYPIRAIVDTGTSLLLLPKAVVSQYYDQVLSSKYDQEQNGYAFLCNEELPAFTLTIGGYRGHLPSHQSTYSHIRERRSFRLALPGSYINYSRINDTHCFGGLQSDDGIPFSIFGDVLLKAYFVVFDAGNLRVGFARK